VPDAARHYPIHEEIATTYRRGILLIECFCDMSNRMMTDRSGELKFASFAVIPSFDTKCLPFDKQVRVKDSISSCRSRASSSLQHDSLGFCQICPWHPDPLPYLTESTSTDSNLDDAARNSARLTQKKLPVHSRLEIP
jgi:hypothetical protein